MDRSDSFAVSTRARRCFELTCQSVRLLLDFDAGLSSLLQHQPMMTGRAVASHKQQYMQVGKRWLLAGEPQLEVPRVNDLAGINAVLVSSASAILALPYLTEYTTFSGTIFATAATVQLGENREAARDRAGGRARVWQGGWAAAGVLIECHRCYGRAALVLQSVRMSAVALAGRQLMLELVGLQRAARERPAHGSADPNDSASPPSSVASELQAMTDRCRLPYSEHDIHSCLLRITPVNFGELLSLPGGLTAVALASGASIGGCIWHIYSNSTSFVYCAACYASAELGTSSADEGADVGCGACLGCSCQEGRCTASASSVIVGSGSLRENVSASKELQVPPASWRERIVLLTDLEADADLATDLATELRDPLWPPALAVSATGTAPGERAVLAAGAVRGERVVLAAGAALRSACAAACRTCAGGGSVLIPSSPHGASLALIEALSNALRSRDMRNVPIYLLSPVQNRHHCAPMLTGPDTAMAAP